VPVQIGLISRQIAIYTLHVYTPDEKIEADYKAAIRQLEQIASGTLKLNAEGVASTTTGAGGVRVNDRERPMTEQTLKGWI
jgi:phage gp36-like protein